MTTTQHTRTRSRHTWHLVRHYLEMVVAMVVGMMVLGPLEALVWPGLTALPLALLGGRLWRPVRRTRRLH